APRKLCRPGAPCLPVNPVLLAEIGLEVRRRHLALGLLDLGGLGVAVDPVVELGLLARHLLLPSQPGAAVAPRPAQVADHHVMEGADRLAEAHRPRHLGVEEHTRPAEVRLEAQRQTVAGPGDTGASEVAEVELHRLTEARAVAASSRILSSGRKRAM